MGDISVPVTSPIRPTAPDQHTVDLSTPPKQQQQQQQQQQQHEPQQEQQHQQQQEQQQQQQQQDQQQHQQQPDSSPAKTAGLQDRIASPPFVADPDRERKQKHLRDFLRKGLTGSGTSAGAAPPRSILTSEQSGQLVLASKFKKKKSDPAPKGLELPAGERTRVRLDSKVLPELVTPGGAELGELAKFVESWNAVDCPENSSLSWGLLRSIEHSVTELQEQLEVSYFCHLMFILHTSSPSPRDSG